MAARKNSSSYGMSATPAIVMAQVFAAAAITLMLVWILHFRRGISLKSKDLERLLNAHPVLMLFGPIISTGQAIMAFKIVPLPKKTKKIIHMLLNLAGLVLGTLGLYAIFKFYHVAGLPNLYTLHSWTGIGAMCLYVIQFLFGFTFFLFPGAKNSMRVSARPWHAFFGLVIFILVIFTSGTGLIQRFRLQDLVRGSEALVLNFTGLAIVLFGIAVVLSVILP